MSKKNKNSIKNTHVVINLITEYGYPPNGCKYAVASPLKSEQMTVFEPGGKAIGKISEYVQLAWSTREIISVFAWKNGRFSPEQEKRKRSG